MSEVTETLSSATDELMTRLQASPTDLRKLVGAVLRRDCQVVGIAGAALARWGRDDLEGWTSVLEWLTSRGYASSPDPKAVTRRWLSPWSRLG